MVFRCPKKGKPIIQSLRNKPRSPVPSMEYRRYSVLESFRVPLGLFHCLGDVQPLHPLALNMDPREAGKVRDLSIALGSPGLYSITAFLEDVGELKLTGAALSL